MSEVQENMGEKIKATFLKDMSNKFKGEARLYKLDPIWEYEEEVRKIRYIVVSGVANAYISETYIFEADSKGNVLNWIELPGSHGQGINFGLALEDFEVDYESLA